MLRIVMFSVIAACNFAIAQVPPAGAESSRKDSERAEAARHEVASVPPQPAQGAMNKTPSAPVASVQPWSQELVRFLSIGVLTFSALALMMATALLWRSQASAQQVLRTVGVISIVAFSALLLVVGYNNEQLTPIVGLFGAIAGYLLGKDPRGEKGE